MYPNHVKHCIAPVPGVHDLVWLSLINYPLKVLAVFPSDTQRKATICRSTQHEDRVQKSHPTQRIEAPNSVRSQGLHKSGLVHEVRLGKVRILLDDRGGRNR